MANQSTFDQKRLQVLNLLLCNRIDSLFNELGVNVFKSFKLYYGACAVHGGNNDSALNVYPHGHSAPGYWKCNTRGCQDFFKKTLIGLVRGILSHQKFDWTSPKDKFSYAFDKTIKWCCDFVGQKFHEIKFTEEDVENNKFCQQVQTLLDSGAERIIDKKLTRKILRERLIFPAKYFVQRGWSEQILDRYDVGLCVDKTKPMCNRAVVPVYDDDGSFIVGCTGRSVNPQCNGCGLFHPSAMKCDEITSKNWWSKWRNSAGFDKELFLYNLSVAKPAIARQGKLILCEGPGDVWKLAMAGYNNAVAMLGASLSEAQQILIEKTAATHLIIVGDNDAAGDKLRDDVYERMNGLYKMTFPQYDGKDVGGLSVEQIQELMRKCGVGVT